MNYAPLYKKNKNDRWQQYKIKIIESDNKVLIEKSYGLIGGKIRINYEEVKEVKSQKNILDQAKLIANRLWINKQQTDLFKKTMDDTETDFIINRDFRPQLA